MFTTVKLVFNTLVARRANVFRLSNNVATINQSNAVFAEAKRMPAFMINQNYFSTSIDSKNKKVEAKEAEDDVLYRSIQIEARCADQGVLDSYQQFVTMAANNLGITIERTWKPFRTIQRRTLLRAKFVKKKYRVQYDFRTYYRNMEFKHLTGSTASTFLEYIERNLPEGTALKVTKEQVEALPAHLNNSVGDNLTTASSQ